MRKGEVIDKGWMIQVLIGHLITGSGSVGTSQTMGSQS